MGLLVALTVGAVIAVVVMLLGLTGSAVPSAPAPATAAPLSTRGVVIASAACTDPTARDLVELRGADGRPRKLPLDACGTPAGSIVALTVPAGDTVAHLAGAGTPTGAAPATSPMAGRLTVTLVAVAAIGVAGLLVALGRERLGRQRWSGPRPGRSATKDT